ncbi:hypothetical protein [Anaeromyxobacter sp. SG66]|uniref:hypothetical protein n=1 Tax=Anaeromyxobacter sp. SG66 TaxID=2925410 RepID=UPI001F59F73E|nr:hypothetical protein [Anaeromyxobacter sp. SG66]
MSATNRGGRRSPADYYATPEWCVRRLLEAVDLPGGKWLEPAAGDGAIVRAVRRPDVTWDLWELRDEERWRLASAAPGAAITTGDFIEAARRGAFERRRFAVAITNPPFRLAQEFIDASLTCADTVVMLLRLNYLASKSRWSFMSTHAPDVYVLPNRPSFTGGGTDSIEYAWFVWGHDRRRRGTVQVLGLREDE